jgi:ORF6N domain
MPDSAAVLPSLSIEGRIPLVRGHKVSLDADPAELHGVPTGRFKETVKRNRRRFPEDFLFQLTRDEGRALEALRSQIVTLKRGWEARA